MCIRDRRLTHELATLGVDDDNDAAVDAAETQAKQSAQARTELEQGYSELTRKMADRTARKDAAARDVERGETRLERVKNEIEEVTAKLGAMNANSAGAASGNLFIASAGEALEALDAARKFEQDKVQALSLIHISEPTRPY